MNIRFIIQVAATAVLTFFATWYTLPVLKAKTPGLYGVIAGACGTYTKAVADVTGVDVAVVEEKINRAADTVEGKINETVKTTVELKEAVVEKVAEISAPEPAPQLSQQQAAPAPPKHETAPKHEPSTTVAAAVVVEEEPESFSDPDDPRSALNKDPGYDWGVVVTNSYFYDDNMKITGILRGGTVIERNGSIARNDGTVYRCYYLINREWSARTVNIYSRDLVTFMGKYEEANKEQRDIIIEYCELSGKLEELRAKLIEGLRARNPYATAYKNAQSERGDFDTNLRAMDERIAKAEGPERMELIEKRRIFYLRGNNSNQGYNEAKKRYDDWNAQNVNPNMKTADMLNIENRLKALKPKASAIVPGL